MRCFFGLPVLGSLHKAAQNLVDAYHNHPAMRHIHWTPTSNWHLTVRFLGEITEEQRLALCEQTKTLKKNLHPVVLNNNGILLLPQRRPKVFCLSVRLNDGLAQLYQQLNHLCKDCGIEPEPRPFVPHITLGRWDPPTQEVIEKVTLAEVSETIDRFHLYESKDGIYTPLETFTLA